MSRGGPDSFINTASKSTPWRGEELNECECKDWDYLKHTQTMLRSNPYLAGYFFFVWLFFFKAGRMTTLEQLFFCKGWYVRKPIPNDPKSQRLILPFALIKYNKLEGNLSLQLDLGALVLGAHLCLCWPKNRKCNYSRASPVILKMILLWHRIRGGLKKIPPNHYNPLKTPKSYPSRQLLLSLQYNQDFSCFFEEAGHGPRAHTRNCL